MVHVTAAQPGSRDPSRAHGGVATDHCRRRGPALGSWDPVKAIEFQELLNTHGNVSNMSGVGNCYDNAVAESFFGLLKLERVHRRHYRTRAEARADIF